MEGEPLADPPLAAPLPRGLKTTSSSSLSSSYLKSPRGSGLVPIVAIDGGVKPLRSYILLSCSSTPSAVRSCTTFLGVTPKPRASSAISALLVTKMATKLLSWTGFSYVYQTTELSKGLSIGGTLLLWSSDNLACFTSGLVLELCGPDESGEVGGVEAVEAVSGSLTKLSLLRSCCESAPPALSGRLSGARS